MPRIDVKEDNRSRKDIGISLKMLEQARQNMNLDGTAGYGRCRVDKKGNIYDMNGENIIDHIDNIKDPKTKEELMARMK